MTLARDAILAGIEELEADAVTGALSRTALGAAWMILSMFPVEGFKLGEKKAKDEFMEFARRAFGDGRSGGYARAKDALALSKVWRNKHGDPDAVNKDGERNTFWSAIYAAPDTGAIVASVIDDLRKLATPKGRDRASQQGLRAALYPKVVAAEKDADKAADDKAKLQAKADDGNKAAQAKLDKAKEKTEAEKIADNIRKVKAFMGNREKVDAETATEIMIAILTARPDLDLFGLSAKITGLIEERAEAAGLEPAEAA